MADAIIESWLEENVSLAKLIARGLTERQGEIVRFLFRYHMEHGCPPVLRDICKEFDISSPNGVVFHLMALDKKGWLRHDEHKGRHRIVLQGYRWMPVPLDVQQREDTGEVLDMASGV